MYSLQLENFDGPLELLLDLIEKRKYSITNVSLAAIADDYLTQVKKMIVISPREIAQFLVVASTLMLIKSRSLLPELSLSEEEEQSVEDLERRLSLLGKIRQLSQGVRKIAEGTRHMYAREIIPEIPVLFFPPPAHNPSTLHAIIQNIIETLPHRLLPQDLPQKTVERIVSLEEKAEELLSRIQNALRDSFRSFVGTKRDKSHIIVSFLALLELIKQGHIFVEQQKQFGDIAIEKQ